MNTKRYILLTGLIMFLFLSCSKKSGESLSDVFLNPPESASPWVYWHWIKAGVSKGGITADLEAMKEMGIGGACLFSVQGADDPPLFEPAIESLTPEWWEMIEYTFSEAKRLGLKLAMHSCDGFSIAGGPWITEEMSMQKLVWSELNLSGKQQFKGRLPLPEIEGEFYKDIAVFAYPNSKELINSTSTVLPSIKSNMASGDLSFLVDEENTDLLRSKTEGWIQYDFKENFTCRSIHIRTRGLNYASNRLIVESSDDGVNFTKVCRLEPPRGGWQDAEYNYTHSIPPTRSRHFRFTYSLEGVEPGSEDMDMSRWNPALRLQGLHLSSRPAIHQYEGKNGSIWRISKRSDNELLPDSLCIPVSQIIDITKLCDSTGTIEWDIPKGNWTILRIGHASNGHTNYIGGNGLGLECNKFDPEIVEFQFDQWFGKIFEEVDSQLANEVLKVFLMDSWECGSQNWSTNFKEEFFERRGYKLDKYLPVLTGLPLENAEFSEQVLYDVRNTIDELITDNFFATMAKKAKEKGCTFKSESIAPIMHSDAMTHYKHVDIPMGEFWYNSPTHDKPNDVLDAISAAHIYGKKIVQAEAFTTLRMDWNEHPAMLKTMGDRNFALGINRFDFHVFAHNPWTDKKPGMTLNTVGLYFQRDQIWWEPGKAWVDYITRCQALLQQGDPLVDIAVFTGEEYPRRALTPDRLVSIVPGLFSEQMIEEETKRLKNEGVPMLEKPYSITSSANTFDPAQWVDPLRGYKYDSFNKDVLLGAKVKDGKIVTESGMSYSVLILPGTRKASPDPLLSEETVVKLMELVKNGAQVILQPMNYTDPGFTPPENTYPNEISPLNKMAEQASIEVGKGKIINTETVKGNLEEFGIERDLIVVEKGEEVYNLAWTHRKGENFDLYFISNQNDDKRELTISLRSEGNIPKIFDPRTGDIYAANSWETEDSRTVLDIRFEAHEAFFIVMEKFATQVTSERRNEEEIQSLDIGSDGWTVSFDPLYGGVKAPISMSELKDWTSFDNDSIRYYSGTAVYSTSFTYRAQEGDRVWVDPGKMVHLAQIVLNGKLCGTAWTPPYYIEVTDCIIQGENKLEVKVSSTWKNRILGDNSVFAENPLTFTSAPFRIGGHALVPSGLLGPVQLQIYNPAN